MAILIVYLSLIKGLAYLRYLHLLNYVNILLFDWVYFTPLFNHYIEQNICSYPFRRYTVKAWPGTLVGP